MKKIHSFILGILVIILTTGCGNTTTAVSTTSSTVETTDTPVTTTDVVAASEPSIQEDTTSDTDDFYVDGAFYPKEYAISLGFKAYESGGTDDCLGIVHDGIEYFLDIDSRMCSVYWTTGNRCYGSTLYELSGADYSPECRIKTGNITEDDSNIYLKLMIDFINKVASGNNMDAASWVSDYSEASYAYGEFDCTPQYYSDGFIDPHSFTNTDMEKMIRYHYYD